MELQCMLMGLSMGLTGMEHVQVKKMEAMQLLEEKNH